MAESGGSSFEPENNVGLAFGLNVMAGACTGIGAVLVVLKKDIGPVATGGVLTFSAGVMVFVSFVEIYMSKSLDAFKGYFDEKVGLDDELSSSRAFQVSMASFFGGILITMGLDYLVHFLHDLRERKRSGSGRDLSRMDVEAAAEGDAPGGEEGEKPGPEEVSESNLVTAGLITAVAIALHNFPEGLATFMAALVDAKLGAAMAIAIAIHNIPEGMAVALPIFKATGSRWKAVLLGTLSGLTEPLGGLVGYLVVVNTGMSDLAYAILFGVVAGMMVYISMEELFPLALKYDAENKVATKTFYLGMLVIGLSLVLFTI